MTSDVLQEELNHSIFVSSSSYLRKKLLDKCKVAAQLSLCCTAVWNRGALYIEGQWNKFYVVLKPKCMLLIEC